MSEARPEKSIDKPKTRKEKKKGSQNPKGSALMEKREGGKKERAKTGERGEMKKTMPVKTKKQSQDPILRGAQERAASCDWMCKGDDGGKRSNPSSLQSGLIDTIQ